MPHNTPTTQTDQRMGAAVCSADLDAARQRSLFEPDSTYKQLDESVRAREGTYIVVVIESLPVGMTVQGRSTRIMTVEPNGQAYCKGIEIGDRIAGIEGVPVSVATWKRRWSRQRVPFAVTIRKGPGR